MHNVAPPPSHQRLVSGTRHLNRLKFMGALSKMHALGWAGSTPWRSGARAEALSDIWLTPWCSPSHHHQLALVSVSTALHGSSKFLKVLPGKFIISVQLQRAHVRLLSFLVISSDVQHCAKIRKGKVVLKKRKNSACAERKKANSFGEPAKGCRYKLTAWLKKKLYSLQ